MKLTTQQMARLLYKRQHEPRRNQKRYLKDLGGDGSADELDAVLAIAEKNSEAVSEAQRLDRQRAITARTVELGVDGRVAEMLAAVRLKMEDEDLTQQDVADAAGWPQSLLAAYLNGRKEPGIGNLAKLAEALGCSWELVPRI